MGVGVGLGFGLGACGLGSSRKKTPLEPGRSGERPTTGAPAPPGCGASPSLRRQPAPERVGPALAATAAAGALAAAA